ncbi:MAG: tRNA modification GTPase MnmE [Isosphaeraceae bacterium]|jgi:tRNA modification GTPase|nr:MAG: tRNA modification GTPase MnmE [Isosphaeraceae bacterium]
MAGLDLQDTIVAPATALGPAARGIIRLSGAEAWSIARSAFVPDRLDWPAGCRVFQGRWQGNRLRRRIPALLGLWAAPRSYTTEDVAEIHVSGAPAIVRAVLGDCLDRGARLAEPGEFTLRAFLAGRIDLTRAEAVLATIEAHTPSQLEAALKQLAGGLADPVQALRDRLLDELAYLEATLDFTEEPDVAPLDRSRLAAELATSSAELDRLAERLRAGERAEGRPLVVLHGPPNAGKSRLFNALLGQSAALVADQPGTTRDYLQAECTCAGLVVDLVDTAGVDTPGSLLERRAQQLRAELAARADLVVACCPADGPAAEPPDSPAPVLWVMTKADLGGGRQAGDWLATSAATGAGLEELKAAIAEAVRQPTEALPAAAATAARCHESLVRAGEALRRASEAVQVGQSDEFVALEVREAVDALGQVVGVVVTDDILDRVFARFCIGK